MHGWLRQPQKHVCAAVLMFSFLEAQYKRARVVLYTAEACPPPEAFSIKCRQDDVPACGPGGKTLKLDNYCTAYPVGSVLQWARAEILATKDPVTNTTTADYKNAVPTTFASPAIATCPAGATGTNVWYPFITAYKNSRNCFCTSETSCKFEPVNQVAADSAFKVSNFNSTFNITIHGKCWPLIDGIACPPPVHQ